MSQSTHTIQFLSGHKLHMTRRGPGNIVVVVTLEIGPVYTAGIVVGDIKITLGTKFEISCFSSYFHKYGPTATNCGACEFYTCCFHA